MAGATPVDLAAASHGHDACAATPWVETYRPAAGRSAYHPDEAGMRAAASLVESALSASGQLHTAALRSGIPGRCVDVKNSGTADGTPVQLYGCDGPDAQRWTYAPGAGGALRSLGGCLDVSGGGTADRGAYSVNLNNGVNTELTATARSGMARFTFPATTQANLLFKLNADKATNPHFTKVSSTEVSGSVDAGLFCASAPSYTAYFDTVFDQPMTSNGTFTGGDSVTFNTTSNRTVQAKVGLPYVSIAGATANRVAENGGWDFNGTRTATHNAWNSVLNKIAISGGSPFANRAQDWKNIFNPTTGFIQPKPANGSWKGGFNPTSSDQFVEGTSWQYTGAVPHNVRGIADAMGGNAKYTAYLDSVLSDVHGSGGSHADLGNEPSIELPWQYDYVGQPWRTQKIVRQVQDQLGPNNPAGWGVGNDDLGTMSAWYVWSAMGFYPETPGTSDLALGSPQRATPHLKGHDPGPASDSSTGPGCCQAEPALVLAAGARLQPPGRDAPRSAVCSSLYLPPGTVIV